MPNRTPIFILAAFFIFFTATLVSCSKENDPTIGVIIVKDYENNLINQANVTLSIDEDLRSNQGAYPESSLNRTEQTDAQGRVEFTYDLEAIFDVTVVKYSGNDTLIGQNTIALIRGETITQIVRVN